MKRLDGMKWSLFPAFCGVFPAVGKAGAGKMKLGLEFA
jgi:hypothetical protein